VEWSAEIVRFNAISRYFRCMRTCIIQMGVQIETFKFSRPLERVP
jgi:hypothetical protein